MTMTFKPVDKVAKPVKRLSPSKCVQFAGTDHQVLVPQEKRRIQRVLEHLHGSRPYLVTRRVIVTAAPNKTLEDRTYTIVATTMAEALAIADEYKWQSERDLGHHHGPVR